jgi:superfamily II DNA helicase RecQ
VRWIESLQSSGHLESFKAPDNPDVSLLRVAHAGNLPRLTAGVAPTRSKSQRRTATVPVDSSDPELDLADQQLYHALRRWRSETGTERKLPAYIVMHDRVLKAIATSRPTTVGELEDIAGLGPTKIEQYGDDVIEIVKTYTH